MILKASQRGGAKQLGLHLLRTDENEHVAVHEVRGFVADDIVGALREPYAVSRGTRCKQFLFSVSMNPPQNESVGVAVFERTADRIEERTGLRGQPRVIVFHEKEGRRHAHCVWSRIDAGQMRAVNLAHFKTKLRDISKELYRENDWQMPRGFIDSQARDPRNFTLAEWQQAKRMGRNARDLKAMMQECWAASDSRPAFEHALGERGILLAKGDRRGHVAVTHEGEVLSLARQLDKKAKEVRARLGEPDQLPGVGQAKTRMAQDMGAAFRRHMNEARTRFDARMGTVEAKRQAMTAAHAAERHQFDAGQRERWLADTRERQDRFNKGMRGLWDRLTGRHGALTKRNEREMFIALQRDRDQHDALVAAQLAERQRLQDSLREIRRGQAALLYELRADKQKSQEALEQSPAQRPEPPPRPQRQVSPTRGRAKPRDHTDERQGQEARQPPAQQPTVPSSPPRRDKPVPRQAEPPVRQVKPITEPHRPEAPTPPPVRDHFQRLSALRSGPETPTPEPQKTAEPARDASSRLEQLRNNTQQRRRSQAPERER